MKRILPLLLVINAHFAYAQSPCDQYCLNFEDTFCSDHLIIDTVTYSQNLWQIGAPQKPVLNSPQSPPNVIITDTVQPYPANDTSVFVIKNLATEGDIYGIKTFIGSYYVQSDSLLDFGMIEFSPDNGTLWIDIINDTVYTATINWSSQKPVLTGNSNGWKHFDVFFSDLSGEFNVMLGDTLIYRFTFISDSIADSLGGLMYDDICFYDFVEGISETRFKSVKSRISPNPSSNIFTINFVNPANEIFQLAVYDINSKLILTRENISENKIVLDAQSFEPGMYVYKLTNLKAKKRSWGKFITAE